MRRALHSPISTATAGKTCSWATNSYRNLEGRKFQMVPSGNSSLRVPRANAAFAVADYDRDGRVDIYVTAHKLLAGRLMVGGRGNQATNRLLEQPGELAVPDVTRDERRGSAAAARPSRGLAGRRTTTAGRTSTSQRVRQRRAAWSISRTERCEPSIAARQALRLRLDGGHGRRHRQRRPDRHLCRQHVLEGRQPDHRQPLAGVYPEPVLAKLRLVHDRQPACTTTWAA